MPLPFSGSTHSNRDLPKLLTTSHWQHCSASGDLRIQAHGALDPNARSKRSIQKPDSSAVSAYPPMMIGNLLNMKFSSHKILLTLTLSVFSTLRRLIYFKLSRLEENKFSSAPTGIWGRRTIENEQIAQDRHFLLARSGVAVELMQVPLMFDRNY